MLICITHILFWTNLVPTSVSCCCFTFLAHSVQSSLTRLMLLLSFFFVFFIFFNYFSGAFNAIQHRLLAEKLLKLKVSILTILCVLNYLTDWPQFVKSGSELSNFMLTKSGTPQGTVLSPFLFSRYTADCRSSHDSCPIDKFADDTGLTGLITNDDDSHYRQEVDRFVDWCEKTILY